MSLLALRRLAAASVLDVPRIARQLMWHRQGGADPGWVSVCNRHEELEVNPLGRGVACKWEWTSDVQACRQWPFLGRWIFAQALRQWPIHLQSAFPSSDKPEITFILPHRGTDRLPLLHATIASIAAQRDVEVECIVVEQAIERSVRDLPAAVRYIHLPHPEGDPRWRKSWAYNVGVAGAKADIVVCHDADILVPTGYAREVVGALSTSAIDAVFLQRFLFCLTEAQTQHLVASQEVDPAMAPARIRQNWKGGTLAIRARAFAEIGGFDESFVDWSGEDLEFFDRCRAIPSSRYGYLPFVHLWHPEQATKSGSGRDGNLAHTRRVMGSPREERIQRLRRRVVTHDTSAQREDR